MELDRVCSIFNTPPGDSVPFSLAPAGEADTIIRSIGIL
jgi:hypothetical protein